MLPFVTIKADIFTIQQATIGSNIGFREKTFINNCLRISPRFGGKLQQQQG